MTEPVVATVLTRVRLRAALRAGWLRSLWPDEPGRAPGWAVTHAEVDAHLADRDTPAAEAEWVEQHADESLRKDLAAVEAELDGDQTSRLAHLCRVFRLQAAERDLVQACLAAAVDPALLRVYAYLQDDAARLYATDHLVDRLFGHGDRRPLGAGSALVCWGIVGTTEPAVAQPPARTLDPAVYDWLLGGDALDPELAGIAGIQPVLPALPEWTVDHAAAEVSGFLSRQPPTPVRVRVVGAPGSGRRTFAAALAHQLRLPLLTVDTAGLTDEQYASVYLRAHRRAFLDRCAVAFVGDRPPGARQQRAPVTYPLEFVIDEGPGAGAATGSGAALSGTGVEHLVELPRLSLTTRRALWRGYAPWSGDWPAADLERLVTQYRSGPGELALVNRLGPGTPETTGAVLRNCWSARSTAPTWWSPRPSTRRWTICCSRRGTALRCGNGRRRAGSSRRGAGCWRCSAGRPAPARRCRHRWSPPSWAWICSASTWPPW
jgi:hypothetical protein